MSRIGYHPLADLVPPAQVLEESAEAAAMGFDGLFIPDHFHPWNVAPGTPFAWTLVASVAERTNGVPVGTAVTCPILRYNPAIVAQAFATLGAVYEGRIFLGLGTGEALNEVPTGNDWPARGERLDRLREALVIIRKLWSGDHVSFKGKYYMLNEAKLYTLPKKPVPVYVSGFGPKATELAGRSADGWITGGLPPEYIKGVLVPAFLKGAEGAGRDPSKLERIAELIMSYDSDRDRAIESCRQIAGALSPEVQASETHDPREIKKYADAMPSKSIEERMLVFDNPDGIISKIETYARLGFTWIEVASLSPDNENFLRIFGKKVLPYFKGQG